jgi:hypothetical protein
VLFLVADPDTTPITKSDHNQDPLCQALVGSVGATVSPSTSLAGH